MRSVCWIVLFFALAASKAGAAIPASQASVKDYSPAALRIADFLLSQQNADGCIPDCPGSKIANEDSNQEYALMGLAAAYGHGKDVKYLQGLRKGIAWLAAREEMTDPQWRGSWFYAFQTTAPYAPVPTSPGDDVTDVRGVDATSALLAYDLYLESRVSGSTSLAKQYEKNVRAGLDFDLNHNLSPKGFSYSSWQQKKNRPGQWRLWRFEYTADQMDVYLGLHAGALLYGDTRYEQAAARLKDGLNARYFDRSLGRFSLGREKDDRENTDLAEEEFDGIFPQGYVPWILGRSPEAVAACQWLAKHEQRDGSLACYKGDPLYSLSVAVYALAASSLGEPCPAGAIDWLMTHTFDSHDGGVRDTAEAGTEKYSNVAGFTILALLRFPAFAQP